MSRTVYVNGAYVPEEEATVSVFDRGFLFADGVYEVTSVLDGKLIDFAGHATRLQRSLDELEMANPVTDEELLEMGISNDDVEEYRVYRRTADEDDAKVIGKVKAIYTIFEDTSASENIQYYYSVTAVDQAEPGNESDRSREATIRH